MTFQHFKINCQYAFGAFVALPVVPILYVQGQQVRKNVPNLPEATGLEGTSAIGEKGNFRVLIIGESTMAGVGVTTNEEGFAGSFATALHKKLDKTIHWKVFAKSGYSAQKVLELIIPTIPKESFDLIVLGMGANDTMEVNTPYTWGKHVRQILTTLREEFRTTPIAFTNMPPVGEFEAFPPLLQMALGNLSFLLKEELQQIVSSFPNVYFDGRQLTIEEWIKEHHPSLSKSELFSDGVHPSKVSYQVWAQQFADFLLKNRVKL